MLAALAFAALLAAAHAEICTPATAGSVTSKTVNLADVTLPPGQQDYDVSVPDVCSSTYSNSQQVGTTVTACDDAAPTVQLPDIHSAIVHRNGNYNANTGNVQTVIYCS